MNWPPSGVGRCTALMCSGKVPWARSFARVLCTLASSQLQDIWPFALAAAVPVAMALLSSSGPSWASALPRCPSDFGVGSLGAPRRRVTVIGTAFWSRAAASMAVCSRSISGWLCAACPSSRRWSPPRRCWLRSCSVAAVAIKRFLSCPVASVSSRSSWVWLCLCLRHERTNPLRVLFIGRLDSYKRLDWLLESLAMLTSSWQLVVVGDGPKRAQFEQLAQRLFSPNFASEVSRPFARGRQAGTASRGRCWSCLRIAAMKPSASCNWRRWRLVGISLAFDHDPIWYGLGRAVGWLVLVAVA